MGRWSMLATVQQKTLPEHLARRVLSDQAYCKNLHIRSKLYSTGVERGGLD